MIRGGVREKLSKIALIHIHKHAEHSLLLTGKMINTRRGGKHIKRTLLQCTVHSRKL